MITIFRGDSADSRFNRELSFSVVTDLNTDGVEVVFSINGVECSAELVGATAKVSISAEQTKRLEYGIGYASVALRAGDSVRTITNDIPVRVTDRVADVDGTENTLEVNIMGAFKNALTGETWDAGGSIASLRDFLARIGSLMGASVKAR